MDLVTVTNEMLLLSKRIDKACVELYKFANAKAEAESIYEKEKSLETLRLKAEGMSVTLIPDVVKGNLYEYLLAKNKADTQFTASRDILSALQTQASMLKSIKSTQELI